MSKVIVDSSAWIHFFNRTSEGHCRFVETALREDRVVTCGLIMTEVLRGARNPGERGVLQGYFALLEYFNYEKADYLEAAGLGSDFRRKGLTVKTIDLLIAHTAMKRNLVVVHDDSDFEHMAEHLSLKTVNPR
jgi:predicted nucleic acid-binding protein